MRIDGGSGREIAPVTEVTPDRWQQIEEMFCAGVDLEAEGLPGFLAEIEDAEMRREVASLIASSRGAGPALRAVVEAEADDMAGEARGALVGRRVGAYQLGEPIGEGGMGTVYAAERADANYEAHVAVKVLRSLDNPRAIARFRDERQILAALEHPGIVRLLDGASTDDGVHYLVMERISGAPITRYARDRALSVRARLGLFRSVCEAVQYAHGKLVVHRDLKPSNIFVDDDGAPRLLDFGIAKLLDPAGPEREASTRTGAALLTPEYASPEQARGEPVTTATDVYSLGAVLYELLADEPPLRATGDALELLRRICEVDPPRPSTVAPPERRRELAGDLDNIVLKAMRKEPAQRYASVEQLAEDLARYLDGRPVVARTPTFGYRAGKFVRRNRAAIAAAVLGVAALATLTGVSWREARRADAEARHAERRFDDLRALADTLVFQLDDKIRDLRGSTAARELVVSSALTYLDRLGTEAHGDADLARARARGYMKIGDIQGSLYEPNLGRPADGLQSYTKAGQIIDQLRARDPADRETRRAYAIELYGTAFLRQGTGDMQGARDELDRAIELMRTLPVGDLDPTLVMRGFDAAAELDLNRGDLVAGERDAHVMVDAARAWRARDAALDARYWVGCAYEILGRAEGHAGDPDAAVRDTGAGLDVLVALAHDAPHDARYGREVNATRWQLAGYSGGVGDSWLWTASTGDLDRAEGQLRDAIAGQAELVGRDREDVRARDDQGIFTVTLAGTIAMRDQRRALTVFRDALALFDGFSPSAHAEHYTQQIEWFAHCGAAVALGALGHRDEALAQIAVARGILASGTALDDETLQCRWLEARTRHTLGDDVAAAPLLTAVADTLEQRVAHGAVDVDDYIGLAATLDTLAEVRPADACADHQRAVAAWHRWPGRRTTFVTRAIARADAAAASCPPP